MGEIQVRDSDVQAAKDLLDEASSTSDVATLREMLADQNGGDVTITTETGETLDVKNIGTDKFAELGEKATETALRDMSQPAASWRNED